MDALLVATTDPIHHGHAYGTPPAACLDPDDPATLTIGAVRRSTASSPRSPLTGSASSRQLTELHRSDFRDTGPVTALLVGQRFESGRSTTSRSSTTPSVLDAPSPSWVAGALDDVDLGFSP